MESTKVTLLCQCQSSDCTHVVEVSAEVEHEAGQKGYRILASSCLNGPGPDYEKKPVKADHGYRLHQPKKDSAEAKK